MLFFARFDGQPVGMGAPMKKDLKYWIGFNLVKGIGPVRLRTLLDTFQDVQSAWMANPAQLKTTGLGDRLVQRLVETRRSTDLEEVLATIHQHGFGVLTWADDRYPESLRDIPQSPPVLYLRGELTDQDLDGVGIVGTRRYTSYGRQVAEEVSRYLAREGFTVISGLARGIDGFAHRAALEGGGRTIAVLGSGVDHIYPPEHRELAGAIAQSGCVLSDYPLGTPPEGQNFPPRNRIISGLSRAVVVIEAGQRSGALITAKYAGDQGREVFAVPGPIYAPQSKGTNMLLKEGAHPVLQPEDILDVLRLTGQGSPRMIQREMPASQDEADIFGALDLEPLHVNEIAARVNLPVEQVTSTLAVMELKGLVRKTAGMEYRAVHERLPRTDYDV